MSFMARSALRVLAIEMALCFGNRNPTGLRPGKPVELNGQLCPLGIPHAVRHFAEQVYRIKISIILDQFAKCVENHAEVALSDGYDLHGLSWHCRHCRPAKINSGAADRLQITVDR